MTLADLCREGAVSALGGQQDTRKAALGAPKRHAWSHETPHQVGCPLLASSPRGHGPRGHWNLGGLRRPRGRGLRRQIGAEGPRDARQQGVIPLELRAEPREPSTVVREDRYGVACRSVERRGARRQMWRESLLRPLERLLYSRCRECERTPTINRRRTASGCRGLARGNAARRMLCLFL